MRSDRDILFGDRFGGQGSGAGPGDSGAWSLDDAEVDALMDRYFDGDISDDDRVRLFGLLRRDADRCLQFVEMQRTTLLLERAPAGPDQTDAILARIARQRPAQRISPRLTRFAVAAAVALAGAGLVIVSQSGPPGSTPPSTPTLPIPAPRGADSTEADAPRVAEGPAATDTARPALRPGTLRSTRTGLFSDPGQPEARIRGLATVTPGFGGYAGGPPLITDPASLLGARGGSLEPFSASPSDLRRFIGFAYGGAPWGIIGAWPVPDESWITPEPARAPAVLEP